MVRKCTKNLCMQFQWSWKFLWSQAAARVAAQTVLQIRKAVAVLVVIGKAL